MSLLTELFGLEAYKIALPELKEKIKNLPQVQKERRSYLLKDWAKINNIDLTEQDFRDVDA